MTSMDTKNGLHVLAPLSKASQEMTELDIIAVHGLNGHPFHTWTFTAKNKSETLWLRDILPSRFPMARIMSFGYDARFMGPSTNGIEDDARDLLVRIRGRRAALTKSNTPIMFVAHSLGGLVVKQALVFAHNYLGYDDILSNTKAIIFLGTPHRGTQFATYASIFGRILTAAGVRVTQSRLKALEMHSDALARNTDFFRNLAPRIQIVSCYETQALPNLNRMVVERDSAIMGIANEIVIPLNADHRSMCRMPSGDDENLFGMIYPELERLVSEAVLEFKVKSSLQASQQRKAKNIASIERHFVVPVAQNSLFTGRKNILHQIREYFQSDFLGQKRVILTGLGGIGKTQIATAFAYSSFATNEFSMIFWTFASSREKMIQSFTDISKHLGIYSPIMNRPSSDDLQCSNVIATEASFRHVEAVKDWLSAVDNCDWLLIFDNADDLESFDLSEFFPRTTNGYIMLTSRRQQAGRFGKQIEVDIMTDEDAEEMLLRCSRLSPVDMTSARQLLRSLGNLPLALDQAGAYIAEQGIDFDEYSRLFDVTKAHVLEHKPPRAVWSYEQTVFTTWEISYAKLELEHGLSVRLLDLAAFFGSDDIPLDLVINLAREPDREIGVFLSSFIQSITTRKDYDQILGKIPATLLTDEASLSVAIGKLLSYSLVQRKSGSRSLSMHPLVHTWLQDRRQNLVESAQMAQIAIALVHRAMFNATDLSQFADVQILYCHAFTCNDYFSYMPKLFDCIDASKLAACIIAVDAWVPLSVDQGTLAKSDRFYQLLSENERSGFKIPKALWTIKNAYRLSSLGLRAESSKLCEEYFANAKPQDRYNAMYQACMAQMYAPSLFRRFLYDRAEAVYNMSPTSCDPSNYMLARRQLVLAGIKCDRGDLDEAEVLFRSCQNILQRRVGPDFFIWSVWHQMLALCFIAQGRHKDAEELLIPIITNRLSRLRAGSLLFSFSDYELAEVYSRALRKQEKFDEAIVFLDELLVLTMSKIAPPARVLGELSFLLAHLDKVTARGATSNPFFKGDKAGNIEKLFQDAEVTYERASQAYEVEWTRGTWVFKFFDSLLEEFRQRLASQLKMGASEPLAKPLEADDSLQNNVATVQDFVRMPRSAWSVPQDISSTIAPTMAEGSTKTTTVAGVVENKATQEDKGQTAVRVIPRWQKRVARLWKRGK